MRVEGDRIEGIARGLDSDAAGDLICRNVLQDIRVREWLAHRLDGHCSGAFTSGELRAVEPSNGDAEEIGVYLGELRDVGRDFAAMLIGERLMKVRNECGLVECRVIVCAACHRVNSDRLVGHDPRHTH